jgi:DNA polymerase I
VWKLKKLLGIVVKGFVHDTYLSEYLRFSGRKSYGLETIADIRFREFAGYKGILDPYKDKETKFANMYTVPIAVEEMYNGADCDLTKRVQMSNKGKYNEALLQCMMRVAPVLARMENKGPWLDLEHHDVLNKWIPIRIEQLLKEIREITGDKDFNPNKPQSVAAFIYDKLKLGKHLDARWLEEWPRSTRKESMQLLADYHHFPKLIMNFRGLSKKKNTYMEGFRKSAEKHGGRVKTKWWLTGTITCRLRSGGEKGNKTVQGLVNLQNIHGDPAIENMLVSDLRWRELYNDWSKQNAGKKEGTV